MPRQCCGQLLTCLDGANPNKYSSFPPMTMSTTSWSIPVMFPSSSHSSLARLPPIAGLQTTIPSLDLRTQRGSRARQVGVQSQWRHHDDHVIILSFQFAWPGRTCSPRAPAVTGDDRMRKKYIYGVKCSHEMVSLTHSQMTKTGCHNTNATKYSQGCPELCQTLMLLLGMRQTGPPPARYRAKCSEREERGNPLPFLK